MLLLPFLTFSDSDHSVVDMVMPVLCCSIMALILLRLTLLPSDIGTYICCHLVLCSVILFAFDVV